jgi:hypothetical protein
MREEQHNKGSVTGRHDTDNVAAIHVGIADTGRYLAGGSAHGRGSDPPLLAKTKIIDFENLLHLHFEFSRPREVVEAVVGASDGLSLAFRVGRRARPLEFIQEFLSLL